MRRITRGQKERTIFEATRLWLRRKLENNFGGWKTQLLGFGEFSQTGK
jgi:hypothetical protein